MKEILDLEAMVRRFKERADGVRRRNMPPVAGAERKAFIRQAEEDFLDYALIADAEISIDGGVLMVDLRPAICDSAIRGSGHLETETKAAMENIANALPTDGNKITPSMLDSKADLQALIDGAEMFKVVETIAPINVNECPGSTLGVPAAPPAGPVGFSLGHGYLV
jgi:hypothetical protein